MCGDIPLILLLTLFSLLVIPFVNDVRLFALHSYRKPKIT